MLVHLEQLQPYEGVRKHRAQLEAAKPTNSNTNTNTNTNINTRRKNKKINNKKQYPLRHSHRTCDEEAVEHLRRRYMHPQSMVPLATGGWRVCVIRHPLATYCTNRNGNMKPYICLNNTPIIGKYFKTPGPLPTMRSSIK